MNLNFKDKATSIDELYQNESFVNLSADERVKKLEDHLLSLSIKEIKDYKKEEFVWDSEKRKDSPHHHTNRLD
ncbi:MAG TPA: hypothetical protein PKG93_04495 [Bacilli bacterium]|nr:hypothetical protein [Bacilli bacterium]